MNSDPLISIGIISFNNENYIKACIESCLSQTYKNIEIIIADDASTDNSMRIIKEYALLYPSKITFISSQENYGIATNFNNAVKASKGEWFKPIACDDVLFEDCVENYMKEVIKNKGDIINDVSGFNYDKKSNDLVKKNKIWKIIHHMQGTPQTMQVNPSYKHVLLDIYDYFEKKIEDQSKDKKYPINIILDPGIGFGKNLKHNLILMRNISLFHSL